MRTTTRKQIPARLEQAKRDLLVAELRVLSAELEVLRKRMILVRWEIAKEKPHDSWEKIESDSRFRDAFNVYSAKFSERFGVRPS